MPELHEYYRAGATEPWTADLVAQLAATVCHGRAAPVVAETGTFMGTTTQAIHAAVPDGTFIITVEADPERWKIANANLKELLDGHDMLVVGDDAVTFLEHRNENTLDFIFLDDDHTAAHVDREIHLAKRAVRTGGLIVVHDVVGPFGLDQVVLAHGGYILDLPRLHAGGGLGLIQVRET